VLPVAIGSLRAASLRSTALVATCAVAIFGTLAVNDARSDLLDGLTRTLDAHVSTADVWVATRSLDLARQPFRSPARRLERVPGVASVRELYGGLHDVAGNRVWVIGEPAADSTIVPPFEVEDGSAHDAAARIRQGGWIALSTLIADDLDAHVGGTVSLPTPTGPRQFRVAATTGNLGWGSGAIVMNAEDYRRAWATAAPSAIEVDAAPGVRPAQLRDRITRTLGPTSGLEAQTSAERLDDAVGVARNGLARLRQISLLLLIASAAAIAIALVAVMREQLPMIALAAISGRTRAAIWRTLMAETILILVAGCLAGVAAGVYGHYLAVRWLHLATGSEAPWSWSIGQAALTCATLAFVAVATTALAGYQSSNASPRLALSKS
jgi:putative ABC transport system permease protein